jgi:hypothetical protein
MSTLIVAVEPVAYWPHPELVYPGMTLMLRTRADANAVASDLQDLQDGHD